MWDNIIESLEMYRTDKGYGCILAHSMGLGKTLQVCEGDVDCLLTIRKVISFSHTILTKTDVNTVLIVVPVNTIQNWNSEFSKWSVPDCSLFRTNNAVHRIRPENMVNVFMLSDNCKTYEARVGVLREWQSTGGCLLIGYEMFRLLADNRRRKGKSKGVRQHYLSDATC